MGCKCSDTKDRDRSMAHISGKPLLKHISPVETDSLLRHIEQKDREILMLSSSGSPSPCTTSNMDMRGSLPWKRGKGEYEPIMSSPSIVEVDSSAPLLWENDILASPKNAPGESDRKSCMNTKSSQDKARVSTTLTFVTIGDEVLASEKSANIETDFHNTMDATEKFEDDTLIKNHKPLLAQERDEDVECKGFTWKNIMGGISEDTPGHMKAMANGSSSFFNPDIKELTQKDNISMYIPVPDESKDKPPSTTNTPVDTPLLLSPNCEELKQWEITSDQSAYVTAPVTSKNRIDEDDVHLISAEYIEPGCFDDDGITAQFKDKPSSTNITPAETSIFLSPDCEELTQKDNISTLVPTPVASSKRINEDVAQLINPDVIEHGYSDNEGITGEFRDKSPTTTAPVDASLPLSPDCEEQTQKNIISTHVLAPVASKYGNDEDVVHLTYAYFIQPGYSNEEGITGESRDKPLLTTSIPDDASLSLSPVCKELIEENIINTAFPGAVASGNGIDVHLINADVIEPCGSNDKEITCESWEKSPSTTITSITTSLPLRPDCDEMTLKDIISANVPSPPVASGNGIDEDEVHSINADYIEPDGSNDEGITYECRGKPPSTATTPVNPSLLFSPDSEELTHEDIINTHVRASDASRNGIDEDLVHLVSTDFTDAGCSDDEVIKDNMETKQATAEDTTAVSIASDRAAGIAETKAFTPSISKCSTSFVLGENLEDNELMNSKKESNKETFQVITQIATKNLADEDRHLVIADFIESYCSGGERPETKKIKVIIETEKAIPRKQMADLEEPLEDVEITPEAVSKVTEEVKALKSFIGELTRDLSSVIWANKQYIRRQEDCLKEEVSCIERGPESCEKVATLIKAIESKGECLFETSMQEPIKHQCVSNTEHEVRKPKKDNESFANVVQPTDDVISKSMKRDLETEPVAKFPQLAEITSENDSEVQYEEHENKRGFKLKTSTPSGVNPLSKSVEQEQSELLDDPEILNVGHEICHEKHRKESAEAEKEMKLEPRVRSEYADSLYPNITDVIIPQLKSTAEQLQMDLNWNVDNRILTNDDILPSELSTPIQIEHEKLLEKSYQESAGVMQKNKEEVCIRIDKDDSSHAYSNSVPIITSAPQRDAEKLEGEHGSDASLHGLNGQRQKNVLLPELQITEITTTSATQKKISPAQLLTISAAMELGNFIIITIINMFLIIQHVLISII